MKQIITILLATICLSSFGQDTLSFKKKLPVAFSQDTVFFVKKSEKSKVIAKDENGYKLVEPKDVAYQSDYELVEPKCANLAQSTDTVFYEQNSNQNYYYQNNTASEDKPIYLEDKLRQLKNEQANTNLTYNTVKYLMGLPYLR